MCDLVKSPTVSQQMAHMHGFNIMSLKPAKDICRIRAGDLTTVHSAI